nr:MAG TPA: hypothetical protein [Caudoviricetes sp.]
MPGRSRVTRSIGGSLPAQRGRWKHSDTLP